MATSYRQKGKKHGLCSHLNPNFLLTDIIFIFFYMLILFPIGFAIVHSRAILDVLCCQQIKLFQVVSTSEFHEYWWKDLDFFFVPLTCCRASEASKIDYFKNKVWPFWTKKFNFLKYYGTKISIFQWGIKIFGPKCSYFIFEVVNFWGFRGPATRQGDKKNQGLSINIHEILK